MIIIKRILIHYPYTEIYEYTDTAKFFQLITDIFRE